RRQSERRRRWECGRRFEKQRSKLASVSGVNYSFPSCCLIQKCYRTYRTNSAKNNCTAALVGKRRRTTVLTSDEVVSTSFVNGHDLLSGCVCYWVESSAAESFNPRFQGNNSAIRLTGWSAMRSST